MKELERSNAKELAKALEELETESDYGNVLMCGMLSLILFIVLAQYMQSLAETQLQVAAYSYPAVAGNAGLVWIKITPAGEPNQVKIISENSTGAFEEVLLGLTT
ncbi:MAG: hypothetical protein PHQ43_15750 [Dehalococcoidales bacterium]|nr:hypothetical protein [Dehalococcoidales bacterium]